MWGRRTRRRSPRRSSPRRDRTGRGLFERVLFSFMGPPQLGDPHAPRTVPLDPAAALCPRCGSPWDAHPIVRTPSRTYATCPPAAEREA